MRVSYTDNKAKQTLKKIGLVIGGFLLISSIFMGISEMREGMTISGLGIFAVGFLLFGLIAGSESNIYIENNRQIIFETRVLYIFKIRKSADIYEIKKVVRDLIAGGKGTVGFWFYNDKNKLLLKRIPEPLIKKEFWDTLKEINPDITFEDRLKEPNFG